MFLKEVSYAQKGCIYLIKNSQIQNYVNYFLYFIVICSLKSDFP